jgi:hypothetical protein
VEWYTRGPEGWLLHEANSLNAAVELPDPACALALAEVYAKVTFGAEPEGSSQPSATSRGPRRHVWPGARRRRTGSTLSRSLCRQGIHHPHSTIVLTGIQVL